MRKTHMKIGKLDVPFGQKVKAKGISKIETDNIV
jgi:hypothetical protein